MRQHRLAVLKWIVLDKRSLEIFKTQQELLTHPHTAWARLSLCIPPSTLVHA